MKFLITVLSLFLSLQAFAFTSEVVAKIGKDVVTSRKVFADTIVENNWSKVGTTKSLSTQSEDFTTELNRYLMERVVYIESRSFSLIKVTDKEVESTKKAILSRIKRSNAASLWNSFALTSDEASELIRQKISSQKFIDFKSKASYVPVTEAEAFNYYQNNKSKYEGKEYKAIKENIKKSLARHQAEQRLEDWYDILKKKYDVTKTMSYVAPE
jgi:hypothetical protein